jgi:hypothetical protein
MERGPWDNKACFTAMSFQEGTHHQESIQIVEDNGADKNPIRFSVQHPQDSQSVNIALSIKGQITSIHMTLGIEF